MLVNGLGQCSVGNIPINLAQCTTQHAGGLSGTEPASCHDSKVELAARGGACQTHVILCSISATASRWAAHHSQLRWQVPCGAPAEGRGGGGGAGQKGGPAGRELR